jgi:hypothetical protein
LFCAKVSLQLVEAKYPFPRESFVVEVVLDDMVQHRLDEREVGVRLWGDPLVGLSARWGKARINDDQFGFSLRTLPQQIGESDRVRLGLIRAVFRFSWKWRKRSPIKIMERTNEEATDISYSSTAT